MSHERFTCNGCMDSTGDQCPPSRSGSDRRGDADSLGSPVVASGICFPGGRRESSDRNYAAAAVREASEELGVPYKDIQLCGTLDFFAAHNGFMVYPFVGIWDPETVSETPDAVYRQWDYNRDEVAELFSVPLSWFLQHEPRIGTAHIQVTRKDDFPFELVPHLDPHKDFHQEYPIYFYQYGDKVIWGMTAAILHSFLERFGKGLADFA